MQEQKSQTDRSSDTGRAGMDHDTESETKSAVSEVAGQVQEKVSEKAGEVKEKATEQADAGINKAAEGLQRTAEQMRERAGEQGGVKGEVATRAADGLEKTATYLREHEATEIWTDVEAFVKEHPVQAAISALAAGFVLGRVLR